MGDGSNITRRVRTIRVMSEKTTEHHMVATVTDKAGEPNLRYGPERLVPTA